MNNELYVLLCYCDTEEKLNLLKKNINFLKNQNKKILISSHYPVPQDIQNSVDYYFFDKENEMLFYEKGDFQKYNISLNFFDCLNNIHIEGSFLYSHSYAVWDLMQKAINIAYFLQFKKIHFLNYDFILKSNTLIDLNNFLLDTYNSVFYYFDEKKFGYFCSFLSFKTEIAYTFFNYFKNIDDYYLNEWESPGLELVLNRLSGKMNQTKIVLPHFLISENAEIADGFYLNNFLHSFEKINLFYFTICLNAQTDKDCIVLQKIIDFSSCKIFINGSEYTLSFNTGNRGIIDLPDKLDYYDVLIQENDNILFKNRIKKLTHLSAKKL